MPVSTENPWGSSRGGSSLNMNVGAKCWSRDKGGCTVPCEGKGKSGHGSLEPEDLPAGVGSNSVVLLITLAMAPDRLLGFVC